MNTFWFIKSFKHSLKFLCLGLLIGGVITPPSLIQAKNKLAAPQVSSPFITFTCTPILVVNDPNSIGVRCSTNINGVNGFAYPTKSGDTSFQNRSYRMMLTAFAIGKKLEIVYDPNSTDGVPYGCVIADCRQFAAIWLEP